MEHRHLRQEDLLRVEPEGHLQVVQREHHRALGQQHALGQSGGAAGVHEHRRVVLLGLRGYHLLPGRDQVLVRHVVRRVTVAHEDDGAHACRLAYGVDDGGEDGVDEDHLGRRVSQHVRQLARREAQVERIHDAAAHQAGVVELLEARAVERQHREAVLAREAELLAQCVRQPEHPRAVLGVGRGGSGTCVGEERPAGEPVHGRQQLPVPDELLHEGTSCAHAVL